MTPAFANETTEDSFYEKRGKMLPHTLLKVARRRLGMLSVAHKLDGLRIYRLIE